MVNKKFLLCALLFCTMTVKSTDYFDALNRLYDIIETRYPNSWATTMLGTVVASGFLGISVQLFYDRTRNQNSRAWYDHILCAGGCTLAHTILLRKQPQSEYYKTFISTLGTFLITSQFIDQGSSNQEFMRILVATAFVARSITEVAQKAYLHDLKGSLPWIGLGSLGAALFSKNYIERLFEKNHYSLYRK